MPEMERTSPWIIAILAIALFVIGAALAFTDRSVAATSAWGFAFLLTILLLLSKFKRFKGFGFEAELWDQKQAEAEELVGHMKSLSKLVSWQMSSVAARLGLWDSAFSLADLARFLGEIKEQLKAIKIPPHEIEEALQPLYTRIEAAYLADARHEVSAALKAASDSINRAVGSTDVQQHLKAVSQLHPLHEELRIATTLPDDAVEPFLRFIEESTVIEPKAEILGNLTEINLDLKHFRDHRSFRRRDRLSKVAH